MNPEQQLKIGVILSCLALPSAITTLSDVFYQWNTGSVQKTLPIWVNLISVLLGSAGLSFIFHYKPYFLK